jgi:hypothetical protein
MRGKVTVHGSNFRFTVPKRYYSAMDDPKWAQIVNHKEEVEVRFLSKKQEGLFCVPIIKGHSIVDDAPYEQYTVNIPRSYVKDKHLEQYVEWFRDRQTREVTAIIPKKQRQGKRRTSEDGCKTSLGRS